MNVEQLVNQSWADFGEAVTRGFVLSFGLKYGSYSPESIAAKSALSKLTGDPYSPSADSAVMARDAVLRIPNRRSSNEPRVKGRSVD